MPILVESRRKKPETLLKRYESATLVDVTSRADLPWQRFSPFFPHGDIPVPFSSDVFSESVEGIWQGLKVFENEDIDTRRFTITSMKGLKRTVRKYGDVLGHRKGVEREHLLDYRTARYLIYLPAYHWVLDHRLQDELSRLKELSENKIVILLDYTTNEDLDDLSAPLSHAGLIKKYIEHDWPIFNES